MFHNPFSTQFNEFCFTENLDSMSSTTIHNYKECRKIFEFIIELGIRLKAKSETIANASVYCYKVLKNSFPSEICIYTMATSCFLLAGKITNDPQISVRDVMNISYCVLHPSQPPLEIGELSYSLRESLVEMELVVLRFLRFKLNFEHPHPHLALMLAKLRDLFHNVFDANPNIDRISAMFLQDLYAEPRLITDHRPETIAILVISMTFTALKLDIPPDSWIPTLQPKLQMSRLQRLTNTVLKDVYRN